MNHDPIHLVTGGDLRFLPGLQVTIASALIGIPEDRHAVFHVLDGGLSKEGMRSLQSLAKRCHRKTEMIFHTVPQASLDAFVPGPGNSRMYYARIGMASLMNDVKRVIYLDSDVLVQGNLSQLWETDSTGAIVMACRDRKVNRLCEDSPWPLTEEESNLPYFNSGVMLVDLARWRGEGIEQQCLNLIAKPAGPYRWWDQTILNHLLRGRIRFLSQEWNWQSGDVPRSGQIPIIIHYTTGIKPWFYWGGTFRFKAWRACYKACVGSPGLLFLTNSSWRGLIHGIFDGLMDISPLVRILYLTHLKLILKLDGNKGRASFLEQKIKFLTSPQKSRNRSREKQLLNEYKKRMTQRLGRYQS